MFKNFLNINIIHSIETKKNFSVVVGRFSTAYKYHLQLEITTLFIFLNLLSYKPPLAPVLLINVIVGMFSTVLQQITVYSLINQEK